MNLFQKTNIILHSGKSSDFKIDCDALSDSDLETIAYLISKRMSFSKVYGIPTGGERLAKCLEQYCLPQALSYEDYQPLLIVDDVCTTGNSFREAKAEKLIEFIRDRFDPEKVIGVCIFARDPNSLPHWVKALFHMDWS